MYYRLARKLRVECAKFTSEVAALRENETAEFDPIRTFGRGAGRVIDFTTIQAESQLPALHDRRCYLGQKY
jgi:hypothetical protein